MVKLIKTANDKHIMSLFYKNGTILLFPPTGEKLYNVTYAVSSQP